MTFTDNPKLMDSAFFSISNLKAKEAIIEILKNDFIERELKVFAIDQNFDVLYEMLSNQPTEDEIRLVLIAMELHPILDFIVPLENLIIEKKDDFISQHIEEVLNFIKTNGVIGNKKWSDEVK